MVLNQFYFHCEEILLVQLIYDRICAEFFLCAVFNIVLFMTLYLCGCRYVIFMWLSLGLLIYWHNLYKCVLIY